MTPLVLLALLAQAPQAPAIDRATRAALVWPVDHQQTADWISTGLVGVAIAAPCLDQVDELPCWRRQAVRVGLAAGVSELVKRLVGRRRPNGHDDKSMPSMHTAIACAAVLKSEAWALCPAVGYLRIAADWHWATDVAAGAAIGSLTLTIRW